MQTFSERSRMDAPLTVLKARIALLATAIGGPDYSSHLDPPPYRLGDDCLTCLKDLKRWFKLVDDQQNKWDVAMAIAEYRVLIDDLLPILIEWENKSSLANKLSKKDPGDKKDSGLSKSREYHDNIALHSLQLMVLLTWPLSLTDQSTPEQISVYSDLKKHQIVYKKSIISTERGKVLKAAVRLASKVVKLDKLDRTPRDNMILRLVLNFLRNILSIEPGELSIASNRSSSNRGINATDTMPPNVSLDDISINAVVAAFHRNKVLALLLLLSGSSNEFDNDFIDVPLMEIMFQMTKGIGQDSLYRKSNDTEKSMTLESEEQSSTSSQLKNLLDKEKKLKKNVIQNTSTRHSRFGALLSIRTADDNTLTISGGNHLLSDRSALKKLDDRKKWNKRITKKRDDIAIEGLPNSLLNSKTDSASLDSFTIPIMKDFIENFIESGFNLLLHRLTNRFTTDEDQLMALERIEYLLFFSWFVKCQRTRCSLGNVKDNTDVSYVSVAMEETAFILVSSLLRRSYEEKNWTVVHAGMIAFNELLLLVSYTRELELNENIEFIISKLFSDERIKLLADLPKQAFKHTIHYMRSCIDLTHTALKVFELYDEGNAIMVTSKARSKCKKILEGDVTDLMKNQGVDRDEALEILQPTTKQLEINFAKVKRQYINESTVATYINFLQRFRELDDGHIKKGISFLHRVLTEESEEALLFRIDFIILLREMLSSNGLSKTGNIRKHIESFSDYFLHRLKKKLKISTSWFIGLLFPLLHSQVGYFQKYGRRKLQDNRFFYAVPPSLFKNIENEDELPESHLLDLKYGILISSLIDDGKIEAVNVLKAHLEKSLAIFKSLLSLNVQQESELSDPPSQIFKWEESANANPLIFDRDLRALIQLIGYVLPNTIEEHCYLPGSSDLSSLENSLSLLKKYLSTPFQTKNGMQSSSYLIRPRQGNNDGMEPDGWIGAESYDYEDPYVINDDATNEADETNYFDELGGMSEKISNRQFGKGLAKFKVAKGLKNAKIKVKSKLRKPKGGPNLETFETGDIEGRPIKERLHITSKEYISDSDEDDDLTNPIFFENEMFMRYLLDKYNGQLPDEKYAQFGRFAAERMANGGKITNNYDDLFGKKVPSIESLADLSAEKMPDKSLISLSNRITKEAELTSHLPAMATELNFQLLSDDDTSNNHQGYSSPTSSSSVISSLNGKGTTAELGSVSNEHLGKRSPIEPDQDSELAQLPKKRRRIFIEDDDD